MPLIKDGETLVRAWFKGSEVEIPIYDDGFGPLFIHRNSIGVSGIVRARTWEEAYEICEDEFFPEATETVKELQKEYGFEIEHRKVLRAKVSIPEGERPEQLGAFEKFDEPADYSGEGGRLPEGAFIRWARIETPNEGAWMENDEFQEGYGFRPNGPNSKDKLGHGIYSKDLNGDRLDVLTRELVEELEIELEIETEESEE